MGTARVRVYKEEGCFPSSLMLYQSSFNAANTENLCRFMQTGHKCIISCPFSLLYSSKLGWKDPDAI